MHLIINLDTPNNIVGNNFTSILNKNIFKAENFEYYLKCYGAKIYCPKCHFKEKDLML